MKKYSMQTAFAVLRAMIPILLYATVSTVLTFLQDQWSGWPVKSLTGRTVLMNLICIPLMTVMLARDGRVRHFIPKLRKKKHGRKTQNREEALLVIFLAGAVCSMASSYLMSAAGIYDLFSNSVQEELLKAPLWLQLIGLGLIVPVSEEMIYRGLVYQRLKEGMPPAAAAVFMAAVFALGHGNLIQILYAFPSGLLLAYIMEGGGLTAAVAFHMGANLFSVVVNLL